LAKRMTSEKSLMNWAQWYMPVIPATGEVEIGGSQFEANLGKKVRPYLKKKAGQNQAGQNQAGHGDSCL
jgi:hypothetical protein